ncbi:uncharacterised protein [Saccharolobus solfataricus]|uniref:Uncharacterized protein n=1 Tax=Saccharolobus solfataricus TaxID=2287 RepID=A0A157T2Y9_SACSO|nr:uncharacterised protein [Saccharolobus solfataricus]
MKLSIIKDQHNRTGIPKQAKKLSKDLGINIGIGEHETRNTAKQGNRSENIKLPTGIINGNIIQPQSPGRIVMNTGLIREKHLNTLLNNTL